MERMPGLVSGTAWAGEYGNAGGNMQEIRKFLETDQEKAKTETVNMEECIKLPKKEISTEFPLVKEVHEFTERKMENSSENIAMAKRPVDNMEAEKQSGQNRRYFRVRLTIAALLFLFFAAGVYLGCLPDWLTKERIRDAFADNSLAQYLEEEAAKALASSDISKGEE